MNRLGKENSPYLLQHAHNPVDWFPWGEEAFAIAKTDNKPILVSIGYSTCHWCHVMERESFEDEETAAFMNQHFVNIKVDREERPDVDQVYMDAVQVMTGAGGWPLNCFLTPEGKPFFGGTYYPPESKYGRPSWLQVLNNIQIAFRTKRQVVEDQAIKLLQYMEKSESKFINVDAGTGTGGVELTNEIFERTKEQFDPQYGGFGGAPKFPGTMGLRYLLDYYYYSKNDESLKMVEFSLEKMIRGGIYDQIGGGFARYATDHKWLVPHFEKMLYDNALLISSMSQMVKLTDNEDCRRAIKESLDFVDRELTSPEGGFFTALDADSEGVEGKFYVWSQEEFNDVLVADAQLASNFYGVTSHGNWEGNNILWRPLDDESSFWENSNIDSKQKEAWLDQIKEKLIKRRTHRIRPALDNKIITSLNAMMSIAYLDAFDALKDEKYRDAALRNIDFLFDNLMDDKEGIVVFHSLQKGEIQRTSFLEDYAHLIAACLRAYESTFDINYLNRARDLTNESIRSFWDKEDGLFFNNVEDTPFLPIRKKDIFDSAVPSPNSTMAYNLLRLDLIFGDENYGEILDIMLGRMQDSLKKFPLSFARWARVLQQRVHGIPEIAVVGENFSNLADEVRTLFFPGRLLLAAPKGLSGIPQLEGKDPTIKNQTLIYLCEQYACLPPVENIEELKTLLK